MSEPSEWESVRAMMLCSSARALGWRPILTLAPSRLTASKSQRRAVDDAMAVAREQRAREAAVDEALSLATAHARDVVQREGISVSCAAKDCPLGVYLCV